MVFWHGYYIGHVTLIWDMARSSRVAFQKISGEDALWRWYPPEQNLLIVCPD